MKMEHFSLIYMTIRRNCVRHRAAKYFKDTRGGIDYKQLIIENQDAFQAGNPYPDAFYPGICAGGKYHDVSEDTHWAPFLKTTVEYIRENYPRPWDKEAKKLVVFLLGFASHQVADVSWHSLGIDQGFLATMGDINFFGSFSNAHSVGDIGGDVLCEAELNLDYIGTLSKWYIPVKDLVEIYKVYYNDSLVHEDIIIECTSLLFLERLGEKLALSKLYDFYSSKSPFMVEELESYFLGGVDDMASWTQTLWHETIFMLENGTSHCDIPHNPIYIHCSDDTPRRSRRVVKERSQARGVRRKLTSGGVTVTSTARGVYLSPLDSMETELQSVRGNALKKIKMSTPSRKRFGQPETESAFYVDNAYARLGWSSAASDVDGDGCKELVIGAPGYGKEGLGQLGRVYVICGSEHGTVGNGTSLNLDEDADAVLQGSHAGGKFGSSVSTLDLNVDGFTDIAVSAPSMGSADRTYTGEVYVFFGSKSGKWSTVPNMTVTCKLQYCNLGWALSSGDFNEDGQADLLIGSPFAPVANLPQAGMVSVLYSTKSFQGFDTFLLTNDDMNVTISGEQEYGWLGHKISLRTKPGLYPLLLVSQPTYRLCANPDCAYSPDDTQSVGSLLLYSDTALPKPLAVLSGTESFEKLGASASIGDPFGNGSLVLAVASSTKTVSGSIALIPTKFPQAGQVTLFNISSLRHPSPHRRGPLNWDLAGRVGVEGGTPPERISWYEGDRGYGRFGGTMLLEDVTGDGIDDLIVGSPLRTEDITEELFKVEEGFVYVYQGGPAFSIGDVTGQCDLLSPVKPCPSEKAYTVLSSNEGGSRFGSQIAVWTNNKKAHLVISAPRSNLAERLAGGVYIFALEK